MIIDVNGIAIRVERINFIEKRYVYLWNDPVLRIIFYSGAYEDIYYKCIKERDRDYKEVLRIMNEYNCHR